MWGESKIQPVKRQCLSIQPLKLSSMSSQSTIHSSDHPEFAQLPQASPSREESGKTLATMLLAALVAALVAAADSVVYT